MAPAILPEDILISPMVRRMHKFKALNLYLRNADADMHWVVIQGNADLQFLRTGLLKASPFFREVKFDKCELFWQNNTVVNETILHNACGLNQKIAETWV